MRQSVESVKAYLLPALHEAGGLFSYYALNDGDDTIAGLNVYVSEEKALAANDIAAAFNAEHTADFLPDDPLRVSGQLGVAALAEVQMGENLVGAVEADERAFVSIRVYDGINPDDLDAIVRHSATGYLPIINTRDDFIAYFQLPAGDKSVAVSIFASAGGASASNAAAADYVTEHMAPLLPNPPLIIEGSIDLFSMALLDQMMALDADDVNSLYGALRVYDNVDLAERPEDVDIVEAIFLPIQQEATGFFGYFNMNDGESRTAALSIFDSEENAQAATAAAADFIAEHFSDSHPETPLRVTGQLGVAALAEIRMGANLVGSTTAEQVFASVRVYDGVDPDDQDEIGRLTGEGFLPIMRDSDGFVGYFLLSAGDELAAISMFRSEEQASASNEKARDFVVENLAPLLPNAPRIVEGVVEVSYVAIAEAMAMDAGISPSHALLAIYDGFDMARLDATVALVESVFVPDLRESGGLFSYHGISDGVDTAVALRIMDSEASLQRGSDIAADFVAEHLAGWLPPDPLQVSGQLTVAALAEIDMGANLIGSTMAEQVFASVRVYDGINPADQGEIARLTAAGFLPIMRDSDGFVGYYLLPAGDMLASVSLFDSPEQAAASNEKARDFVVENLAPLLPNAPKVYEGELSINHVPAHSGGELFASVRFYEGFDLSHFDEANDMAIAHLLPALEDLGGLFAQYALNDGEDTVVGISIFADEEASVSSNDVGKAFTMEYLADWAPNPPTGVSGKLAIAALAEVRMGENLVGDTMAG